jgi:hypothetical protein
MPSIGMRLRDARDVEHVIELVQFLDHDHDALADSARRQSQLDKLLVLETVQHQQAVAGCSSASAA